MNDPLIAATRREALRAIAAAMPAVFLPSVRLRADDAQPVETATLSAGNLQAVLRDNSSSPKILSGLDSLHHLQDAPEFDAFDPDSGGASAGLNFEHIISGHNSPHNSFTPRRGPFALSVSPEGRSATLVRKRDDDPWEMPATMTYTLVAPHAVDLDFQCTPQNAALFGERKYAILFFANYMNDVEDVSLHFRGVDGPDRPETWIAADAPPGPPDWNQGGTYRSLPADDLTYDADHNFTLNSWSYDYPRFTQPFYYGRAANGMVLMLMFDRMHSPQDEIRFSLFKFKLKRFPRPAWDFQYVIRDIQQGRRYGFRARLVWKQFVSPDDCLKEYEAWTLTRNKG